MIDFDTALAFLYVYRKSLKKFIAKLGARPSYEVSEVRAFVGIK